MRVRLPAQFADCVAGFPNRSPARWAQVRAELGLAGDQYSCTALMGAAGREGDAAAVEAAFDEAWAAGIRSTYVCNTAMGALARARHSEVGGPNP